VGSSDAAAKLEHARGLLRRAEDRAVRARPAPETDRGVDRAANGRFGGGTDGRVLPVVAPLARLLPAGGLRRGTTVAVAAGPAATSLLWAVLVEASAGGAWVGVVGRPDLGLVAAAEAGMRLERLALVPAPGLELLAVTSALLDGLDVVVMAVARPVPAGERQRLAARARQRGAVLCVLGPWSGADVRLSCTDARWSGVGAGLDGGSGRLGERQVEVRVVGRGMAPAGRVERLLMPARPATPAAAPAPVVVPAPSPGAAAPAAGLTSVGATAVAVGAVALASVAVPPAPVAAGPGERARLAG
jgi:hypothetical protein